MNIKLSTTIDISFYHSPLLGELKYNSSSLESTNFQSSIIKMSIKPDIPMPQIPFISKIQEQDGTIFVSCKGV